MKKLLLLFCCFSYVINSSAQSSYVLSNTGIPSNFNTYDFIVIPTELFAIGATFGSATTPGIYKSTNNGSSWAVITATGLQNHNSLYTAAAMAGSTCFMNAASNTGSYGIYRSDLPALSALKEITGFTVTGMTGAETINSANATVALWVTAGTDLSQLSPAILISNDAGISPAAGVPDNFSTPVVYTVTAQDGSTKLWTVTIEHETATGISKNHADLSFRIGPSPCDDQLFFNTGIPGKVLTVELTDLNNKVVATACITGTGNLSVAHLPAGIYFLRVPGSNASARKIVIMR